MSDTSYYIQQYATLAGFRLLVLANRFGSTDEFSRTLHDELIAGLEGVISMARSILSMTRELASDGDPEGLISDHLAYEQERFAERTIILLDELEIDHDTHEYRVNGGEWHIALSADCDGVDISYPKTVRLTDAELGSLATIIRDIRSETGLVINAARVVYD
ncbi:hypothetical protein [Brucella intermedia]|uniref:hypothetical protein n=1 Tax=Brucella intermedia TaxID=94625 RepID=UPI00224A5F5C|nr:hypothetical protein [Brucella intermedia]